MTEEDLFSHCHLEDTLFLEAVVRLEDERQEQAREENPQTEEQDGEDSANDALSDREKEVIVCVVKGMSNKGNRRTVVYLGQYRDDASPQHQP